MGFLSADTGGYHRLLASVGLILVAVAIVAPWLFLRELDPLTIEQSKLDALTPRAREVLLERQDRIEFLQDLMPFWVIGLGALGGTLVFLGARGLRELQPWEVREAKARVEQVEASIRPQSEAERQQRALEDVAAESVAAAPHAAAIEPAPEMAEDGAEEVEPEGRGEPAEAPSIGPISSTFWPMFRERAERWREIEDRVLDRLEGIPWHAWTFSRKVAVIADMSQQLLLDALLKARDRRFNDWIIEVTEHSVISNALARITADRVLGSTSRYQARTGRRAAPWLIVVADDDAVDLGGIERQYSGHLLHGVVTAVRLDDLDRLQRAVKALG